MFDATCVESGDEFAVKIINKADLKEVSVPLLAVSLGSFCRCGAANKCIAGSSSTASGIQCVCVLVCVFVHDCERVCVLSERRRGEGDVSCTLGDVFVPGIARLGALVPTICAV